MPFGLKNAAQDFQSLMDGILQDIPFTFVYIDKFLDRSVFDHIHGLSNAGARPTQRAISQRFVRHGMKRDIRKCCKECHACQTSKIHQHTKAPLVECPLPKTRFCSLHFDLVRPLPASQGMTYLFAIIDRFTKWPETVPLPDAHASTCAAALVHHWIARFGVPEDIISDVGRQFTSTVWAEYNKLWALKHTQLQPITPGKWHG